jgi:hypothetical protein
VKARALLALALAACSSPESAPTADAGASIDAAEEPALEPGERVFVSNTPQAKFIDTSQDDTGLRLLSSFFDYHTSAAGDLYARWRGEIENTSSKTICEFKVNARALHGAGDVLETYQAPVYSTKAYADRTVPKVALACLLPGEKGIYSATREARQTKRIADFARVELSFTLTYLDAKPWAGAPTMTFEPVMDAKGASQVKFTVTAGTFDMSTTDVFAFFADERGLLYAEDNAFKDGIKAGETWTETTTDGPPGAAKRSLAVLFFTSL